MSQQIPLQHERVIVDLSDEGTKYLIGWPGYRNAEGRSGLGYFETNAEWGHMRGRIFRMLITGKVITRNLIFLFGMFIVGMIYSLPVILGIPEILVGNPWGWTALLTNLPACVFGMLLLGNVLVSLFRKENDENNTVD